MSLAWINIRPEKQTSIKFQLINKKLDLDKEKIILRIKSHADYSFNRQEGEWYMKLKKQ